MSKKKPKVSEWVSPHHDGVSDKTMIGRPVKPMKIEESPYARFPGDDQAIALPLLTQEHTLEVTAWVDYKRVGHVLEKQDAHYPDDGIPYNYNYNYDGRTGIIKALRELADRIESDVPTGDWP